MSQNVSEAIVGVTGAIYSFAEGVSFPYGAHGALPISAVDHGFASEEGVTVSGSRSTTNIYAWQNATLVRTVTTEASVTYQFELLQTNEENQELFYGRAKNATTGGIHWDPAISAGKRQFVIDVIDESADKKLRYWIPSGEVTEIGDQQIVSSDVIKFSITITAYKTDVEGEPANTIIWEDTAEDES